MNNKHVSVLAGTVVALSASLAQASTVELSNMVAQWYGGVPAANVSYFNNASTTPQARWGVGAVQSGYDFDIAAQPIDFTVPPSPSPNMVLGTFTHLNFPISAGTSITSVNLKITTDVIVDGTNLGSRVFDYGFNHWETPNADVPCANGGANGVGVNINGCADRVIANWLPASEDFLVGTDLYTLNVKGFSLDINGTNPFTSFWTAENQSNNAYLIANVALLRDVNPAPEPGTPLLLGAGLIALASAWRAKAKKG